MLQACERILSNEVCEEDLGIETQDGEHAAEAPKSALRRKKVQLPENCVKDLAQFVGKFEELEHRQIENQLEIRRLRSEMRQTKKIGDTAVRK
ncbi:MAG: hypothetical protein MHM6MM_008606 [Cercozoa sp. M6MM]